MPYTETTLHRSGKVTTRTTQFPTRLPRTAYSTLMRTSSACHNAPILPRLTFVIYPDHDESYIPEEFTTRYDYSTRQKAHYDYITSEDNKRTKDLR